MGPKNRSAERRSRAFGLDLGAVGSEIVVLKRCSPYYQTPSRIPILRRWVNKVKKRKGGGLASPTISAQALLSGSLSHSLGRTPRFKTRRHNLGGLGLDKR
jgi:hypothetical protein